MRRQQLRPGRLSLRSALAITILIVACLGCSDVPSTGPACAREGASCTIGELASALGVYVGASFVQGNSEPVFRTTLVEHFNSTTAPIYWESTQRVRGTFDFSYSDEVVELAEANGLRLRGHPLVWGQLGLPDAALFVNEFGVMAPGPKQERFYALIRDLVAQGAPISGVGFQGHIRPPFLRDYDPSQEEIEATVRRFVDLGLRVEITEIDVTIDPSQEVSLAGQAETYRHLTLGCFRVPGCDGITTWGVTDKYTWIRDFFAVDGTPLLFDEAFQPKPAYDAVAQALKELLRERR